MYGGRFDDEFMNGIISHDRPFLVSMANSAGKPNTNGSQFFVTLASCPWLDGKHTIFGKVFSGSDTVTLIENSKCDSLDRPLNPIKILQTEIL